MQGPKRALAICLSITLMLSVVDLDGCNKKSDQTPGSQGQAPATTYATPTPDQLYQRGENARMFERTASRLDEMQSSDWLELAHLPS